MTGGYWLGGWAETNIGFSASVMTNESGPLFGLQFSCNPVNLQIMLRYALIFFVIALIAGVLGFGGFAAGMASIAKILCYIFLVLLAISLVSGLLKRA